MSILHEFKIDIRIIRAGIERRSSVAGEAKAIAGQLLGAESMETSLE
jgi:hypothetical protein